MLSKVGLGTLNKILVSCTHWWSLFLMLNIYIYSDLSNNSDFLKEKLYKEHCFLTGEERDSWSHTCASCLFSLLISSCSCSWSSRCLSICRMCACLKSSVACWCSWYCRTSSCLISSNCSSFNISCLEASRLDTTISSWSYDS